MRTQVIVATHRATYYEGLVKLSIGPGGEARPIIGGINRKGCLLTLTETEAIETADFLHMLHGESWAFHRRHINTVAA